MSFQLDLEVKLLHDVHDLWNRHRFLFYSLFEFFDKSNPSPASNKMHCNIIMYGIFLVTWNICFWILSKFENS